MNSATESYLTKLARDSTIWGRRGKHGAVCFIEGVIEALVATEVISNTEASEWNITIMSSASALSSEFTPPGNAAETMGDGNAAQDFPQFLELIPVKGALKIVPGVCSIQILGIERYDSKAAIIWRVVPLPAPAKPENYSHFARFERGPNPTSTKLTDDAGTHYIVVGGHSGGRIERVGRFEFQPAPPDGAKVLFVRWEEAAFDIALPRTGHSGALV